MRSAPVIALLSVVTFAGTAVPAGAAADDQSRADEVIAAFNERMADAGWTSQGVPEPDDEPSEDDVAFVECIPGFEVVLQPGSDALIGQTARSYSEEFTWVPKDSVPETTDWMDFDTEEETIAAFVAIVDESSVEVAAEFVDVLGSEEAAGCLEQVFVEQMGPTSTEDTGDLPMPEVDIAVEADDDFGVGDDSGGFSFRLSFDFGGPFTVNASVAFALVDRTLVGLTFAYGTEQPQSGLDVAAELEALVGSAS